MVLIHDFSSRTLRNRTLNIQSQNFTATNANNVMAYITITAIEPDGSLTIDFTITTPDGKQKRIIQTMTEVGTIGRGGWGNATREGTVSVSGSITSVGNVTFSAQIVSYDQNEDIPE